jgi:NAD-dependent dihydropyrimidine dehydrogenase PreA subunit
MTGNVPADCPAASKGKGMPRPIINDEECSGCGICVDACPEGVLDLVGDTAEPVNEDDCTGCATCMEECPMGAIEEIETD